MKDGQYDGYFIKKRPYHSKIRCIFGMDHRLASFGSVGSVSTHKLP
jgi:hypothetical protein